MEKNFNVYKGNGSDKVFIHLHNHYVTWFSNLPILVFFLKIKYNYVTRYLFICIAITCPHSQLAHLLIK